jgi:AbrB family looped-hinge helix DNA binding protein
MTHKVGPKGQVVIPKSIRDRIGIRPGDEVVFESGDEEVRIRRADRDEAVQANRIKALRGIWSDEATGTDELLAERRRECEREEQKAQGHGVGRLR